MQDSFIKVTEVWTLDRTRSHLEWMSGIYGDLDAFRKGSQEERFALGEGLPGKAWATGRPVILKEFNDENFKRTKIAKEAGLSCGMAIPVLIGEVVTGVVVFLCGEREGGLGALEAWRASPDRPYDLRLVDGYYGELEDFAFISSKTQFRKGFGLPGLVWGSGLPALQKDLKSTGVFARSLHADRADITMAMGFPVRCKDDEADIVCMLSSKLMPIASRYEVWIPGKDGKAMSIQAATCSKRETHLEELADVEIQKGQGNIGMCWLTGTPRIVNELDRDFSLPSISAFDLGMRHSVSIPTAIDGEVKAVVAWYF